MSKTLIIDIDGTLVDHQGSGGRQAIKNLSLLPGVAEAFSNYDSKGYNIILLSGRRESSRKATEKQLSDLGLFWDQLILGVKGWPRYLINDRKPEGTCTASAISLDRNVGFPKELIDL